MKYRQKATCARPLNVSPAMNGNSFVSIYFTSKKLLIVRLNPSKKKVEVFASADLPDGIIANYQIKDEKALSEILKHVWQKLKIKEKAVGIVIPEFSTFTKAISLPKLDVAEIDEAVRWQSEEFLPLDPKETILDWKIIGSSDTEHRVLVVAVNEKLLKGYVSVVDMAGLFPFVVETPSISLVRLAGEDESVKLIIYFSFDEIIITLAKGQEILTSSVVGAGTSAQSLISTVGRILRHFDEIAVSKIFVGGVPSDNSFVTELTKNAKIPLVKLGKNLGGITDPDFQKYSIPISLQFKDPYEPKSSKTINLLPPEVVQRYQGKRFNVQVWSLLLIATLIFVGCFMALAGSYLYLFQDLSKYKGVNTLSDVSYQKSKSASDEIKNVNTLADRVIKIDSINIYPQDVINLINQKKPENVAIISYKINLEKGNITIEGVSLSRDDLYEFKKKIEEGGDFQRVVLPLTSFEQGENINFEMSFYYSKLVPKSTK